ncbi:SufE family protein [Caulobacter sp. NIBR1757]|uniref:SufE family protein n=1 Tax=Caulobacter sp. NIBR1757 TaxID=3016000 RepID=UPI0022F0EB76|nr:SufE family protein [Caulobacter sp. NIBR1757]
MTSPIVDEFEALAGEFESLGDGFTEKEAWEHRYGHVIDMGKALPPLPEAFLAAEHRVPGCATPAWFATSHDSDGSLVLRGDAEGMITRGIMSIMLRLFDGQSASDVLAFDAKAAFKRLDLENHLVPSRANGLGTILDWIYREARVAVASSPVQN